ncbi:glutamine-hydrolyzing GMP synthase [Candidatus Peregrinibacteria bacterium]|nr:glutamine-hydrolyzing GMP synthase [Candidatus Peregrinibacteria bacterium]
MDAIAIIDFGSQYAHLIANRVRRLGVYSEVLLPDASLAEFKKYKGIILSGGPQSVYEHGAPTIDPKVFELGIPVLGLCYGHQAIAHLLGGKVTPGETKEYGLAKLVLLKKIGIFEGIRDHSQVWMSHGDTVTKMPPGFIHLGKTDDCFYAAMGDPAKKIFSTQFHMEVTHTQHGMEMLHNFLKICEVKYEWNTEKFLEQKIVEVKKILAGRKVFLMVSGGVDSTVAYALLSEALGTDFVYGLFVDTGLLRKDEDKKIEIALRGLGIQNFHIFNGRKRFLGALKGVINPEEKRKIIGDMFLKVQAEAVKKLKLNPEQWVLGQGTIYPDTIESAGTKYADKIKTHHNRVPEILELIKKGRIVEPLAQFYKDEVRHLGEHLGLPDEIVWKHPFPGPGLAVRILCAKKTEIPEQSADTQTSINKYLRPWNLEGTILPIQSVGVQGDSRTYRRPLAIWCGRHSFDKLEQISTALTNRYWELNRVCLLLTPGEIKTCEVVAATLTEKRVKVLQELDDIVMNFIEENGLLREMWQFPTVLVPLLINGVKKEAVILRPVCSEEAMTANFYKMDFDLLKKLTAKLKPHVSAVLYDVTNKPPGTIEWE